MTTIEEIYRAHSDDVYRFACWSILRVEATVKHRRPLNLVVPSIQKLATRGDGRGMWSAEPKNRADRFKTKP
jgi:hypothetical protein